MEKLLRSPAHAKELAENGHQLAAQQYDTSILSKRIRMLYEELIKEKAVR